MKVWTCNNFQGFWPVGSAAIIVADDIDTAIAWFEEELKAVGLEQRIKPEQLIPMPTTTRKVRILCDGDY